MSDAELIKAVEKLKNDFAQLELENEVFEHFLLKNDSSLLAGMAQILELAGKMQSQTQSQLAPINIERKETSESIRGLSSRSTSLRFTGTTISASERGPRINISHKMDLVMREMEEMQLALECFIKVSHTTKSNLKAELEECSVREAEVTEARNTFEQSIVMAGVDPLTQRIPAEKFTRYMEEWLRSAESTTGKMRLRTSTLKALFTKLSYQLVQKEELGETIDAVDFDQLHIENQHLSETIEQKNTHLLELKRMNGTTNLVLSTNKKYLQKQIQELNDIKDSIKYKEQTILELDTESGNVEKQVDKEKEKYEKIMHLKKNYRVPDIMEYVKVKTQLQGLKKNVKIWERRNHIEQFALNTCIRHMKNITGNKVPSTSWFRVKENTSFDLLSSLENLEENPSLYSSKLSITGSDG